MAESERDRVLTTEPNVNPYPNGRSCVIIGEQPVDILERIRGVWSVVASWDGLPGVDEALRALPWWFAGWLRTMPRLEIDNWLADLRDRSWSWWTSAASPLSVKIDMSGERPDYSLRPLEFVIEPAGGRVLAVTSEWLTPAHWHGIESAPGDRPARRGAVNADLLRNWSETLCRLPADVSATAATRALGIAGWVVDHGPLAYSIVEPPPPGTTRLLLSARRGEEGLGHLDVSLATGAVTRADLDARFGTGRSTPRVHYDSPFALSYSVTLPGAPFACAVFGRFHDEPTATTPAIEVTFRRDAAR